MDFLSNNFEELKYSGLLAVNGGVLVGPYYPGVSVSCGNYVGHKIAEQEIINQKREWCWVYAGGSGCGSYSDILNNPKAFEGVVSDSKKIHVANY